MLPAESLATVLAETLGEVADVVGTVTEPAESIDLVLRTRPDVLLVDDAFVVHDDLIGRLRRGQPQVRIVGVVDDGEIDAVRRALEAGLDGVIPMSTEPSELRGPLLCVVDGWFVLPSAAAGELLDQLGPPDRSLLSRLDDDEIELWARIAAGEHDKDLARRFHVSTRTMKRRVAALFGKLGVDGRVQAAELAGRYGLRRGAAHGTDGRGVAPAADHPLRTVRNRGSRHG